MKRKNYKVKVKLIFETTMDHSQTSMQKAQEDVNRVLTDYLKDKKLNILNLFNDRPPHIIYKVEKKDIKKGDIYYATLNPAIGSEQKGERPVVVLQNDCGNKYSPTVIVAPLTKIIKKEKLPTHILIHNNDFLRYNSLILLEQVRVIDKIRIFAYLGKLTEPQIQKIDKALINVFEIDIRRIEREGKDVKKF